MVRVGRSLAGIRRRNPPPLASDASAWCQQVISLPAPPDSGCFPLVHATISARPNEKGQAIESSHEDAKRSPDYMQKPMGCRHIKGIEVVVIMVSPCAKKHVLLSCNTLRLPFCCRRVARFRLPGQYQTTSQQYPYVRQNRFTINNISHRGPKK